jgi:hypothetical protein
MPRGRRHYLRKEVAWCLLSDQSKERTSSDIPGSSDSTVPTPVASTRLWSRVISPYGFPILIRLTSAESSWRVSSARPESARMIGKDYRRTSAQQKNAEATQPCGAYSVILFEGSVMRWLWAATAIKGGRNVLACNSRTVFGRLPATPGI